METPSFTHYYNIESNCFSRINNIRICISFSCVNDIIPMNYRAGLSDILLLLLYHICVIRKFKDIIHVPITYYGVYFVDIRANTMNFVVFISIYFQS